MQPILRGEMPAEPPAHRGWTTVLSPVITGLVPVIPIIEAQHPS